MRTGFSLTWAGCLSSGSARQPGSMVRFPQRFAISLPLSVLVVTSIHKPESKGGLERYSISVTLSFPFLCSVVQEVIVLESVQIHFAISSCLVYCRSELVIPHVFLTNFWFWTQRFSSEPLRLTVAILIVVALSAFFFWVSASCKSQTCDCSKGLLHPSHFWFYDSSPKIIPY